MGEGEYFYGEERDEEFVIIEIICRENTEQSRQLVCSFDKA